MLRAWLSGRFGGMVNDVFGPASDEINLQQSHMSEKPFELTGFNFLTTRFM